MNGFSAEDMSTAAANGFRDGLAAQPAAAPGIDVEQFRALVSLGMTYGAGSRYRVAAEGLCALIDASPKAGSGQFDYKADFFNSNGAAVRAEGVLLEARNWFEEQAKVISKGGGSSWDLHQVRDMRDRCDSVLQATSAEVRA